jgi:hypothetical protein
MLAMSKQKRKLTNFEVDKYVRTTRSASSAIGVVKNRLALAGLTFLGEAPTQEAIVTASWLWMQDMEPGELATALAEYMRAIEDEMIQAERSKEPNQENDTPNLPIGRSQTTDVDPVTGHELPKVTRGRRNAPFKRKSS